MTQPVVSADAAERAKLDRSLIHGLAWTAGARWATQLLAWTSTLVVARLLSPGDFGLLTMAEIYVGLIVLVSEFGIGTAVVTLRELTDDQVGQLNAASVLLGFTGLLTTAAAALPMARFFGAPELPPVVIAMGAGFVITSFRAVPAALLQRELRFRTLALIEVVRGTITPFGTVVFALLGLRYWALVLGAQLSSAIGTALTLQARRHRFCRPRLHSLAGALRFSWHILVARLCWYGYSNADFVVAGRTLGQAVLGVYGLAWTLATAVPEKITSVMSGVVPGFFASVQSDTATLRRHFLDLTEGVAFMAFPLAAGVALVANDFVLLCLGAKWQAVIGPLQLLALYTSVRSVSTVVPYAMNVSRETRFAMWMSLVTVIVMPTAFYIGSHWGAVGISAAWIFAHPLVVIPSFWRLFRKLNLSMASYMRALRLGLDGSVLMAAAVLFVQILLWPSLPLPVRLAVEIAVGVAVFAAATLLLHREKARAAYALLRLARGPAS
jgi:PST family polysaccharide transporter